MALIRVYGTLWCDATKQALRVLDENHIKYEWVDSDKDPPGEKFVKSVNHGNRSVPTIIFPNGRILVEPDNTILGE